MCFQRLWSLHIKIHYLGNINETLRKMVRSLFFLRTILYSLFLPCNLGACPPRSTINGAFRLIDNDFFEEEIKVIEEKFDTKEEAQIKKKSTKVKKTPRAI